MAGDPVDLVGPRARSSGAGWSTTTPPSLPDMVGRSTRELARELGSAYEREVVHRDDLVAPAAADSRTAPSARRAFQSDTPQVAAPYICH